MLHGDGEIDHLLLEPDSDELGGTYRWTANFGKAEDNVEKYYPHCEGIDRYDDRLYFVSKRFEKLYVLNLDDGTYSAESTVHGLFDGQPDQIQRILEYDEDEILYFTEEAGQHGGIHGRKSDGEYFTILEGPDYHHETTGLSFSPDGRHMYMAYQVNGLLFDVTRLDQRPFQARTLNVQYHKNE